MAHSEMVFAGKQALIKNTGMVALKIKVFHNDDSPFVIALDFPNEYIYFSTQRQNCFLREFNANEFRSDPEENEF